jgi:hypothetical protein
MAIIALAPRFKVEEAKEALEPRIWGQDPMPTPREREHSRGTAEMRKETEIYDYGAFVVSTMRPPVETCAPKTPGTSDFE